MAVDTNTFERFEFAGKRAVKLGFPLVEVLDRHELLLTPKRRHEIEVRAVEDLFRRLDRQTAAKILGYVYQREHGTPSEMFEAVKTWMEIVVRNWANGTMEDL